MKTCFLLILFFVDWICIVFADDGHYMSMTDSFSTSEMNVLAEKAKKGDSESAFKLGRYFDNYKLDSAEAVKWYSKARELGHVIAGLNEAYYYANILNPPDNKHALELYIKLAEKGSANAKVEVARLYEKDDSTENSLRAFYWYEMASKDGKVFSMEKLSEILFCQKKYFDAYVWANLGSQRRKRLGADKVKQSDIKKFEVKLTKAEIELAQKKCHKLDKDIPWIDSMINW